MEHSIDSRNKPEDEVVDENPIVDDTPIILDSPPHSIAVDRPRNLIQDVNCIAYALNIAEKLEVKLNQHPILKLLDPLIARSG